MAGGAVTHEEWAQGLATLAEAERAVFWSVGDQICAAISAAGKQAARAQIFREAASVLQCSASTARTRAKICATFRGESRHPDVDPSIYRACLQIAKAAGRSPTDILAHALATGLHVRGILALGGGQRDATVQLHGTCGECGAAVRVSIQAEGFRGHPVWCPLCEARPQVGALG
jgi:hypothetical protein